MHSLAFASADGWDPCPAAGSGTATGAGAPAAPPYLMRPEVADRAVEAPVPCRLQPAIARTTVLRDDIAAGELTARERADHFGWTTQDRFGLSGRA